MLKAKPPTVAIVWGGENVRPPSVEAASAMRPWA